MDPDDNIRTDFERLPLEIQNRIFFRHSPLLTSELGRSRLDDFRILLAEEAAVRDVSAKELKITFESSLRRKCLIVRVMNDDGNLWQHYMMIDTTLDFQTRDTEHLYTITRKGFDGIAIDRYHETQGSSGYGLVFSLYGIDVFPGEKITDDVMDLRTLYLVLGNRAKAMNLSKEWVRDTFLERFDQLIDVFSNLYDLYMYLHVSCAIFEFDVRTDALALNANRVDIEEFPYYDAFPEEASGWTLYRDFEYIKRRIPELISMIKSFVRTN